MVAMILKKIIVQLSAAKLLNLNGQGLKISKFIPNTDSRGIQANNSDVSTKQQANTTS
jgi:hypothetical protein